MPSWPVKNRCLSLIRATPNGDGFEALRQMILAMRPNSQNRGSALLTAVTSWPAFNMQQSLQTQLLKLEEGFEEVRKTGTKIGDSLKMAVVLKCISGALKTHLNVSMSENMTYSELREAILKWDRAQQKWSNLVGKDDNADTSADTTELGKEKGNSGEKAKTRAIAKASPPRAKAKSLEK